MPLWVVDRGKSVTVWGGVRGVPTGRVLVQVGGKTVKTVNLRDGYFLTRMAKRRGSWQLVYGELKSRVAKPVKPAKR